MVEWQLGDALSQAGDPAIVGKMWANGGQSENTVTPITRTSQQ
jgi:hypothetical protein